MHWFFQRQALQLSRLVSRMVAQKTGVEYWTLAIVGYPIVTGSLRNLLLGLPQLIHRAQFPSVSSLRTCLLERQARTSYILRLGYPLACHFLGLPFQSLI